MKKSLGLAALLPGFLAIDAEANASQIENEKDDLDLLDVIVAPLNTSTPIFLAGHRSHASHSSHGSHRSSAGGGYTAPKSTPTPKYIPPSDPLGKPKTPSTTAPKSTYKSGNLEQRALVIRKVQALLMANGYYTGAIDGVMGPQTRSAILRYKMAHNLGGSMEIDSRLLNSLGILVR